MDWENVCLWGYSFSGGHVIIAAARNSMIKGFMISMPFMDSFFILKINGMIKNMKINGAAAMDENTDSKNLTARLIKLADEDNRDEILRVLCAELKSIKLTPQSRIYYCSCGYPLSYGTETVIIKMNRSIAASL